MNLVNISDTPLHVAFDEVCRAAQARGIRVTGSELVGLVPLQCLLDAGRYFLEQAAALPRRLGVANSSTSPSPRSASTTSRRSIRRNA